MHDLRSHLPRTLVIAALALGALFVPAAANAAPANDDFANATAIGSLPFTDTVDVSDATSQASEPPCFSPPEDKTVWYDYTPTADGVVRLHASGQSNTVLDVYTGSDLSSLSNVTGCDYYGQPLVLHAIAGTTYHIRLAAWPYQVGGSLTLGVEDIPRPANDDFANAMSIGSLPFSDTQDLTAAGLEAGEPSPGCFGTSNTVWYAFTADTTESVMATTNQYGAAIAAYSGSSLGSLSQVGCGGQYQPLTFRAHAGTTYYFQAGTWCCGVSSVNFRLQVAPDPVAQFYYNPGDPSSVEAVQFGDNSYDPAGAGISSEKWDFGDGATASGCCPSHRFANDGDYTPTLTVTTADGRTASTRQTVHVRTHDVSIAKVVAPQSASTGQTRAISVGLTNKHYPETVQVQLSKSVAGGGWQQVGALSQYVPVRDSNRTTDFNFSYTFAPEDATLGKVTFRADAAIQSARDVFPGDNTFVSLPTKVGR